MSLTSPLEELKPKIPDYFLSRLHKLNINTIEDLLYYLPRRHEDFSHILPIDDITADMKGENVTLIGEITQAQEKRVFRRPLTIFEATLQDDSGSIGLTWFNQRYIGDSLKIGSTVFVSGKISVSKTNQVSLRQPTFEPYKPQKNPVHGGKIIPIYPSTAGITSKFFRYRLNMLLSSDLDQVQEFIPPQIISQHNLLSLQEALLNIHFPKDYTVLDQAKERIAFNDLLLLQLYLLKQKLVFKTKKAYPIIFFEAETKAFVDSLPFSLTQCQKKSSWEIILDMQKSEPMNRLLEGDVGSGKTVVAALACLNIALNKKQVALMAPTEILAIQHFENLIQMFQNKPLEMQFESEITIALLTSSESRISIDPELGGWMNIPKEDLLKRIQKGTIYIIIGTQSLISDKVTYADLALAIVDEQHRFGVKQRSLLQSKITHIKDDSTQVISHLLSMTATPIPRTLALSMYGDLDISILDELPKGRKKIITKVISPSKRKASYEFIEKEILMGRQVFVICPRIEPDAETDPQDDPTKIQNQLLKLELKTVKDEYEKLSTVVFKNRRVAMLHGKMKPAEKDTIMKGFKDHQYDILVSTSVIEVGVDVPNASILIIEGAERFGLAQLHQLRGRVGRGEHQSYCFLFQTNAQATQINDRLKAIEQAKNGFQLAEMDLQLRGPGQFLGGQQSGIPDIAMSSLIDVDMIKKARQSAIELLKQDRNLTAYPLLKAKVHTFKQMIHRE